MTKNFKKITLSLTASAVLVGNAFALDPAITNFGYIQAGSEYSGLSDKEPQNMTIFNASNPAKQKTFSSDQRQGMIAISPTGGSFYYSGTSDSSSNIVKYDTYTGASSATLAGLGGGDTPSVFSSDGKKLYVLGAWEDTSMSDCTSEWDCPYYAKVTVVDTATNSTIQTIQTTADGWGKGIAVNNDGTKIYTSSNTMFTIDPTTGNTISSVGHGGGGYVDRVGFVLNSTKTKAYTLTGSIDLSTDTFTAYTRPTSVNGYSFEHMALSTDGTKVYVVYNDGYGNAGNTKIIVYDASTGLDIGSILPGFVDPHISLSPDDTKLFVFDSRSNALKVVDTATYGMQSYTMATKYNFYSLESNIAPNLITGTLSISSAVDMATKGFTNYVNFAGGTLQATGSFTLSNPVYLHDEFNLEWDDSSTFTTVAGGSVDTNGYDVEFSGDISGLGGLTKEGAGVLTLSGTNAYSGATQLQAGTLHVSADTNTSALSVVNGTTLKLDTNASGTSSNITTTGAVTLSGGTLSIVADEGAWSGTTSFTLINSTGGVSGTFGSIDINRNYLVPNIVYEANAIKVNITKESEDIKVYNNNYSRYDEKTVVLNTSSGLMWQDNQVGSASSWSSAITTCSELSLGGYDDWRLPNYNEIFALVERTSTNPALSNEFSFSTNAKYWSSTTDAADTSKAWSVDFTSGVDSTDDKTSELYVRCVRGGQ